MKSLKTGWPTASHTSYTRRETDGKGQLFLDGYEKEQVENEVLHRAGVDSPAALAQYMGDAIHHGRIYSAMHRRWAKYDALTDQGNLATLAGSMEATVKQGQSLTDRMVEITIDQESKKGGGKRLMVVEGSITQTERPEWHLGSLQAFGSLLGLGPYEDAVSQLTTSQLAYAKFIGDKLIQHCADSLDNAAQRSANAPSDEPTK